MRLRLSRRSLRRARTFLTVTALLAAFSVGLHTLGRQVTPPPAPGAHPVLYAPTVRRTERYRRQAHAYLEELAALDALLLDVVQQPGGDLYRLSRAAEQALRHAARLEQAVSLDYPPSTLVSLRDSLQLVTTGYLDAALTVNNWVGEPTPTRYETALEALRRARLAYRQAEANPRLQGVPPPDPRPDLPAEGPAGEWGE